MMKKNSEGVERQAIQGKAERARYVQFGDKEIKMCVSERGDNMIAVLKYVGGCHEGQSLFFATEYKILSINCSKADLN